MGKIIQNGIEYSGTYSNATSINYDGSASGLSAKTVQEAVDELAAGSSNGKDENGMTIHEKLDQLLTKAVLTQVVLVGTSNGDGTISATALENYQNLTTEDFVLIPTKMSVASIAGSSGNGSGTSNPKLEYNSSTGTITVSGATLKLSGGNLSSMLDVNVYYLVK